MLCSFKTKSQNLLLFHKMGPYSVHSLTCFWTTIAFDHKYFQNRKDINKREMVLQTITSPTYEDIIWGKM